MPDMDALIINLDAVARCLDKVGSPAMAGIVRDTIALLREQDETRLVRHYSRPGVYADLWLHCEKCGFCVDDRYRYKHCPECGRAVKWDA